MKTALEALLRQSLDALPDELVPRAARALDIAVESSRDASHGDFASNLALRLASTTHAHPRRLADALVRALPANDNVARVEVAGSGFINFFLRDEAYHAQLRRVLAEGEAYGRSTVGGGRRLRVEFVPASPTGPLLVGHGRQAAWGAAVANLLEAVGCVVQRECYVNDAGRPLQILALSSWLQYLARCSEPVDFPAGGYRGPYVVDIAHTLHDLEGAALKVSAGELVSALPPDRAHGGDEDAYFDALIERARTLLGQARYQRLLDRSQQTVLADVRADLQAFGVEFDGGFSPRSSSADGAVKRTITGLQARGPADRQDDAPRLSGPRFGEGTDPVQSVTLCRGADLVPMSTRWGESVTLRNLRGEVGNDAARLFFVMRSADEPLRFDLQLAKARSTDNPVYDIQYAHARVASVFKQLAERGVPHDRERGLRSLKRLTEAQESTLWKRIAAFPALLEHCAQNRAPHTLVHYLRDLAREFHRYHAAHPILVEDGALRDARLVLAGATQIVIRNGLTLLGVSAPLTV